MLVKRSCVQRPGTDSDAVRQVTTVVLRVADRAPRPENSGPIRVMVPVPRVTPGRKTHRGGVAVEIFATRGRRLTAADPEAGRPLSPGAVGVAAPVRGGGGGPRFGVGRARMRVPWRVRNSLVTVPRSRRRSSPPHLVAGRRGADPSYEAMRALRHGLERVDAGLPAPALLRGPVDRARQPGPPAHPARGALPGLATDAPTARAAEAAIRPGRVLDAAAATTRPTSRATTSPAPCG